MEEFGQGAKRLGLGRDGEGRRRWGGEEAGAEGVPAFAGEVGSGGTSGDLVAAGEDFEAKGVEGVGLGVAVERRFRTTEVEQGESGGVAEQGVADTRALFRDAGGHDLPIDAGGAVLPTDQPDQGRVASEASGKHLKVGERFVE